MQIDIIGIYPIESNQSCHLIEFKITDVIEPLDIMQITQKDDRLPKENWQVPYKEQLLDYEGNNILTEEWDFIEPERLKGSYRIVFFFHHLNMNKPISTQIGEIELPKETNRPDRLNKVCYIEPD